MKPLTPHWADTTAVRIVKTRGEKSKYVLASGITPSGKIHVGNFREVITVDLVARALEDQGMKVRFLYSWDDFDTFRKVPKNLPDPAAYEKYLRQPIARIPDPWGEAESYAQGRIDLFEKELERVGIRPDFIYQHEEYSKGTYAKSIRTVLEKKEEIREILNEHRSSPLADDWVPTSIYCEKCEKDDMEYERYDGGWNYSYKCKSCGYEATTKINETKNMKLAWRTDWPMRWAHEKVDFEPGGKDHSSQGGSYDTGKKIISKLWGDEAPIYLQYDFVMIKGGAGKMSSSSGELYTLSEIMEVYDPQVVRWIFAGHRPNHDFSISFDEDVIKIYDEFDRAEATAYAPCPEKPGKWPVIRRVYELSNVERTLPKEKPYRPGFRVLANRMQICDGDIERTYERYYKEEAPSSTDKGYFEQRAKLVWAWIEKYAPDEFKYTINKSAVDISLSSEQESCVSLLKELVVEIDLESIDVKDFNELIYEKAVHKSSCEPKDAFKAIYQKIISRDKGPRLPSFLKEVGTERLLKLL